MNSRHIILSDLHAIAPGVLEVVFGPDGEHEDAPEWTCLLYSPLGKRYVTVWQRSEDTVWLPDARGALAAHGQMALDLRVPSVAARLLALLCRAISPKLHLNSWQTAADLATRVSRGEWNDDYAARTAELVRWYAPQIVALGV